MLAHCSRSFSSSDAQEPYKCLARQSARAAAASFESFSHLFAFVTTKALARLGKAETQLRTSLPTVEVEGAFKCSGSECDSFSLKLILSFCSNYD